MYTFRKCINLVLQQKLVALSPQPAMLTDLVDKARDLDRSFCMFTPWSSPLLADADMAALPLKSKNLLEKRPPLWKSMLLADTE